MTGERTNSKIGVANNKS